MPVVGLLINESKPEALAAARQLARTLGARDGVSVRTIASTAEKIDELRCSAPGEAVAGSDFVVVLGGDGTLLAAARTLAPLGTPILGVHLGRFGFIAETDPEQLLGAVETVLRGEARIEERAMLACAVVRGGDGTRDELPLGMNDVVVRSSAARLLRVRTAVGHDGSRAEADEVATYAADGVIVASPTGSTSYSLSAGGPLVQPTAPVLLITPICPHTLNARSLIVPDTATVHLSVAERDPRDTVIATVDGQVEVSLRADDRVEVRRAPRAARLLTVGGPNFYQKLRDRWHYGERLQG